MRGEQERRSNTERIFTKALLFAASEQGYERLPLRGGQPMAILQDTVQQGNVTHSILVRCEDCRGRMHGMTLCHGKWSTLHGRWALQDCVATQNQQTYNEWGTRIDKKTHANTQGHIRTNKFIPTRPLHNFHSSTLRVHAHTLSSAATPDTKRQNT